MASTYPVGYLTGDGPHFIASAGVFGNASTELGQKYQSAFNNWPFPGKIEKTIYFWGPLDCLFGTCRGASQYYPPGRTNETTPKADYALYSYSLWLPADAQGNPLPNRIMTDPGSPGIPAVPGIPEGPPKPTVISRNGLGDPNYYPGEIQPQGQIAQMGPNQVYPLLDIIRQSPPGQTRNNAIRQLDQWAKPGSKNRDILIKLGVPLEGASTSSPPQGDIAQAVPIDNTPPRSKMNYPPIDQPSPGTNVELQKAAERAYRRMGLKGA